MDMTPLERLDQLLDCARSGMTPDLTAVRMGVRVEDIYAAKRVLNIEFTNGSLGNRNGAGRRREAV